MRLVYHVINILIWTCFFISCVFFFVGALLIWVATYFFDPNRRILQKYSCFWSTTYLWLNPFWSHQVLGRENYDPKKVYVMVSNHLSLMDILILFSTFFHFKWVSKAVMFKAPFLGWNMKLNGYVPIKRGDPESREHCMTLCKQWIKKGSSILFFPEGTRSKNGQLQPFKPGAFRLALESGADILPMVIRGTEHAVPKHSINLTQNAKMSIEVLPSVSVKKYLEIPFSEGIHKLTQEVYEKIRDSFRGVEFHPEKTSNLEALSA